MAAIHLEQLLPPTGPVPGMPGFEHSYAEVNGTRPHYVTGGSGPVVVLLHGWPHLPTSQHQVIRLVPTQPGDQKTESDTI